MKYFIFLFIFLFLIGCTREVIVEKPVIIEKNITVVVEKIVPSPASVCSPCPSCASPKCDVCPTKEYISRLIRQAKRCEDNGAYDNLTVCNWDLNKTTNRLSDCSLQLCRYNNTWCK
jgi:hypothetical protein